MTHLHGIGRLALSAIFGLVLVSVLLPNTAIAWMRDHWVWFNLPMLWIEGLQTRLNVVHAVLFLLLGVTLRVAAPRMPWTRVMLSLIFVGVLTEAVQMWIPGRHPRVSDAAIDVVAGVLGWAILHGMLWCRR